jgi:hypothetical protein
MRRAILGSWYDMDMILVYQWGVWYDTDEQKENPNNKNFPDLRLAYNYVCRDEIVLSQFKAAGLLFTKGYIHPAPSPTTFTFGTETIYSPLYPCSYIRKHWPEIATISIKYGAEIEFDPDFSKDYKLDKEYKADGEVVEENFTEAIEPSEEFVWDWPNERLVVDVPEAKVVIGSLNEEFKFKDGVKIQNIELSQDIDLSFPFVCFALVSQDGKPIPCSEKLILSMVSTSKNTGVGTSPVLFKRPSAKIILPYMEGRKVRKVDFALETISVEDASESITISKKEPIFYCEIYIETIEKTIPISAFEMYTKNKRTRQGAIIFPKKLWFSPYFWWWFSIPKPAYYWFPVPKDWDRVSPLTCELYFVPQINKKVKHGRPGHYNVQFSVRFRDYKPGDTFEDAPSDTGEPVTVDITSNKRYKQTIKVSAHRISKDAEYIELVIQRPGKEDNYPAGVALQLVVIRYYAIKY